MQPILLSYQSPFRSNLRNTRVRVSCRSALRTWVRVRFEANSRTLGQVRMRFEVHYGLSWTFLWLVLKTKFYWCILNGIKERAKPQCLYICMYAFINIFSLALPRLRSDVNLSTCLWRWWWRIRRTTTTPTRSPPAPPLPRWILINHNSR